MCLGVPARVIRTEGAEALVSIGSVEYTASLLLADDILPGDYVMIHAGFVIEKIDRAEAEETLKLFGEINNCGPDET